MDMSYGHISNYDEFQFQLNYNKEKEDIYLWIALDTYLLYS